jgi:hypothetical protein
MVCPLSHFLSHFLSSRALRKEERLNGQGGWDFIVDLVRLLYFANMGHLALVWTNPIYRPLEALDTFQVGLYTLTYRTKTTVSGE